MSTTNDSKKMKKTSTEGSTSSSDLDTAIQRNLEIIDVCQMDVQALNVKASEEILKIEQKYDQLRKPHFQKRSEIIKNIPNFWFTSIMNHPDLSSIIDEREEECLQFLNRIEVENCEDLISGYRIEFHFDENPYFENLILAKEFHLEPGSQSSQSTPVKWKENNDLSKTNENTNKGSRKRRFDTKTFFGWFSDNVDPVSDDIAEIFKDDLWQNPLQYYLVPDLEENNDEDSDNSDVVLVEQTDE